LDAVQSVIECLKATPGVISCWVLPHEDREQLGRLESNANLRLGLPGIEIVNEGIRDVLGHQHVVVVSHSPALRHPPGPIILILNGDQVVGEEVWERGNIEKLSMDKNALLLGKNLVFNREALMQARGKTLKLVYKALPFPELDNILGIRDVVSVTITVPVHHELSEKVGWNSRDPNIGTVLIGFNESPPTRSVQQI
jgi:hypothetical protein